MAGEKEVSFTVKAIDAASATLKKIQGDLTSLTKSFFNIGAAITAAFAGVSLAKIFGDAVKGAADAESAMLTLSKAIENVGGNVDALRPTIDALVESLAKTTTYKPTELLNGLETLTLVSGNAKGAIAAMSLATDIAAAKHIDLNTAATLVGKVMDGNTSSLKRFGIVLDDNVDAMQQLQDRFGGFAEVAANTFAGSLKKAGNAWDEFEVALGKAIISGDSAKGTLGGIIDLLASAERWINANQDSIAGFTNGVAQLATWLVGSLGSAIKYVIVGFEGFGLLIDTIGFEFETFKNAGQSALGFLLQKTGEWLEQSAGFFDTFGISVDKLGDKLANLGVQWQVAAQKAQQANRDILSGEAQRVAGLLTGGTGAAGGAGKPNVGPLPNAGNSAANQKAIASLREELAKLVQTTADAEPKWQQFQDAIDKWQASAMRAKMSTAEMNAGLDLLHATLETIKNQEAARLFAELWAKIGEQTGNVLDSLTAKLNDEIAALQRHAVAIADPVAFAAYGMLIAYYKALVERSIAFKTELAAARPVLVQFNETVKAHAGDMTTLSSDIDTAAKNLDIWTAKASDATLSAEDQKAALEEQTKWQAALTEAVKAYGDAAGVVAQISVDSQAHRQAELDLLSQTAQAYGGVANAILDAGQALGAFSGSTVTAIKNVVALVEGVAKLNAAMGMSSSNSTEEGAKIGATFGAFGAIIGAIAGLAVGLIGSSKSFSAALDELTANIKAFGETLSGQTIQDKVDAILQKQLELLKTASQLYQDRMGSPGGADAARAYTKQKQEIDQAAADQLAAIARGILDSITSAYNAAFGHTFDQQMADAVKASQSAMQQVTDEFNAGLITDDQFAKLRQEIADTLAKTIENLTAAAAKDALNESLAVIRARQRIEGPNGGGGTSSMTNDFSDILNAYAKVIPQLQDALGTGFDFTSEAGKATLKSKIKDWFESIVNSDAFKADPHSFDDLIGYLTNLDDAIDQSATAVESAAQKINDAINQLNQDADVYGTGGAGTPQYAQGIATAEGIDLSSFDLSTAEGIAGAEAYLRGLYKDATDPATRSAIQATIDAIYKIQPTSGAGAAADSIAAAAGGAGVTSAAVGSSSSVGGLQGLSYGQGDTILGCLDMIRVDVSAIRDLLSGGGGLFSGAGPVSLTVGEITVNAYGVTDATSAQAGARAGVDASLAALRTTYRSAAGQPRTG